MWYKLELSSMKSYCVSNYTAKFGKYRIIKHYVVIYTDLNSSTIAVQIFNEKSLVVFN